MNNGRVGFGKQALILMMAIGVIALAGCTGSTTSSPATSSPTSAPPSVSATTTATPTPSPTVTQTPTVTATPTPSPTLSPTPTMSPSPSTTATPTPTASPTPTPTPASTAAVKIVQPTLNSVQIDADVTVTVQVTGLKLVDKAGQANVAGEGHLIFYLDVVPPTNAGQTALTAAGTYAVTSGTSYLWPNLVDGVHQLAVELVNNDNTPLNPPAVDQISISVFTG